MSELGIAVIALVMAAGLLGTLVPFVPGLPLIWGAALAYGLLAGFEAAGAIAMALITLLMVGGFVAKVALPAGRGRAGGVPRSSLLAGAALAIVGFFVIPLAGLPLGAIAGVLLAEHRRTDDWASAWRSTKEVVVGLGLAIVVELGAGIAMIACWAVWVLANR